MLLFTFTEFVYFYIAQATRWDDLGFASEFIKKISLKSNLVAHQLIWNMDVNMYRDEDGTEKDSKMFPILESLRNTIVDGFDPRAKDFYQREFEFFKVNLLTLLFIWHLHEKKTCIFKMICEALYTTIFFLLAGSDISVWKNQRCTQRTTT